MATTLTIIFGILKLNGVLMWSWWWVFSPILAQVALYAIAFVLTWWQGVDRRQTALVLGVLALSGLSVPSGAMAESAGTATGVSRVAGAVTEPIAATSADTVRVRFALANRLHVAWARATIIRPAGEGGVDVIVVSPETTVADMEKAVRMLLSSHATMEYPLPQEVRGHVSETYQTPPPGELVDELTRVLSLLGSAEPVTVPDHGELPAIEVDLPIEAQESG